MKINLRHLVLVASILAAQAIVFASGKRTPEQSAVIDVIGAFKVFEGLHPGQSPTNWGQISEVLNLSKINQALEQSGDVGIDRSYVFVQQKISIPEDEKGHVVLMRVGPSKGGETNGVEGRYIISRHDSGLKFTWLAETNVQKMLADAGVTELPKPEIYSVPKEQPSVKVPAPVNTATSQTAPPDGGKPQTIRRDLPNPPASKNDQPNVSNTVPPTVATATPGSGPSWLGMIVVLGMGLLFSIFLLFRARQK